MHVLPIHTMLIKYFACCGKMICGGCERQHQMKSGERVIENGQLMVAGTCAFCRMRVPKSDKEMLARLNRRVELKDPIALRNMALAYSDGDWGLPVDEAKYVDFLRQSAGLGDPVALYQLGNFHHNGEMGHEQNEEEARKYWKKAAEGGNLVAMHNLGCKEKDYVAGIRILQLSASGGYRDSMEPLMMCFESGDLHHRDLAKTLQAMYRARSEMRSEDRAKYIAYLKSTGKYEAEFDW